jgi:hypothetical protein
MAQVRGRPGCADDLDGVVAGAGGDHDAVEEIVRKLEAVDLRDRAHVIELNGVGGVVANGV